MIFIILISVFVLITAWLLFAPLYIRINTDEKKYDAGLSGIVTINLVADVEELFFMRIRIFSINFMFYPFRLKEPGKKAGKKKKTKKKKRKMPEFKTIWLFIKIFWKVIKSSKIKKLKFSIDTDDVIKNAYLIPVFAAVNRKNINLNVNYSGRLSLIVDFENNIFNMLFVTIKTCLRHKKII